MYYLIGLEQEMCYNYSVKQTEEIGLLWGEDAEEILTEGKLRAFAVNSAEGTHRNMDTLPKTTVEKTRHLLRELLHLFSGNDTNSPVIQRVKQFLYPNSGRRECYDERVSRIKEVVEGNNIAVARIDGEVAGIAGFEEVGPDPVRGRIVCEIVNVSVLPRFRGKGVASQLMTEIIGKIKEDYPDYAILFVTADEGLKSSCHRRGFEDVGAKRCFQIWDHQVDVQKHNKEIQDYERQQATGYLLEPESVTRKSD